MIGSGDAASLGGFGANKVLHIEQMRAMSHWLSSFATSDRFSFTNVVFGGATAVGLDAFARVAVRLKLGLGSEITELTLNDGAIVATRSQFAGKTFSDIAITGDCKMFTVRPGAFGMPSASENTAEVEAMTVDLEDRTPNRDC